MNMQRILGLALFLPFVAFAAEAVAPDEMIRETANEVLEVIQKDKDIQAGNKKKIKELIEAKVLPQFDFTRMTRLAVGRFWSQATPAQQQELTSEFRSLLVRTYSASLSTYKDQKISGLGIYFPKDESAQNPIIVPFYKASNYVAAFEKEINWEEFLTNYFAIRKKFNSD